MTDYQKMYTLLFNAITDALMQMEKQNYGAAKEILVSAQQRAEELYLSAEDESGSAGSPPPDYRHSRPTE